MSAAELSRQRSMSSKRTPTHQISLPSKGKQTALAEAPFEPCAATGSSFLYSQGPSVICLHHDTLAIQRRFHKHAEDIQFISVDNVSERGAGRLVVTYDVGQTAIVWDLLTGEQVARFASYEPIKVAAWMRNGNIAFGNTKGEVILFEPSTSEHVSARTIFDPITALAPSSDCKTYAIGYNNGSILLAALQPTFTILHTLSTSRGPSPIATLTWHASSSKQKSDMLATQTSDGDLRVWSVIKPPSNEAPRVIRVLRRSDEFLLGRNWIAWSKNGRILQFSEGETWSWDVRTKHVTYEPIQTVEHVRAVANYGPTATLFTLGPNHSIQQYDLETGEIVANTQHFPMTVPPTPPDENKQISFTSESEESAASPVERANHDLSIMEAARNARIQAASPQSFQSRDSDKPRFLQPRTRLNEVLSPSSKTERSGTTFSMGTQSQLAPSVYGQSYGMTPQSPVSVRGRKGSRLKQEVLPSPEDKAILDLFPYTRARLTDVPYKPVRSADESQLTSDDLRRQMLTVVFGWEQDIGDLIRDELSRHPAGSQNSLFLSKWLNDDPEHMANIMGGSDMSSQLDWMMLALNGMGNHPQSKKIGQSFVEKMLSKGDVHAAAIILLSLGDRNDAIEVYVAANYFLEAILLTCLLMPNDWQRQKHLVRRWGEHVVENSQQYLAIRCFSCTDIEPSEPWTSPTAQMAASTYDPRKPPPSPEQSRGDGARRGFFTAPTPIAMAKPATPMTLGPAGSSKRGLLPQKGALKLITSFGPQDQNIFRFPGLKSDDRTPTVGPGVTPIAESAIGESALTPGGAGSYRLNNLRSINSALASARTATPGTFHRQRLASIGETPIDVNPPVFSSGTPPKPLPTPADSGSEREREREKALKTAKEQTADAGSGHPALLLTSARYEPAQTPVKETPLTAVAPMTAMKFSINDEPVASLPLTLETKSDSSRSRTGSKSRKPDGLSIQMIPISERDASETGETTGDSLAYTQSLHRSNTMGSYTTTQFDTHSEMTSPPTTGNSFAGAKSPSVSGRSIDQYISSLEQAQYYSRNQRTQNESAQDRLTRKKSKHRQQASTEDDRGRRDRRVINSSKRSPSSPVPMSPDDLKGLYAAPSIESFDSIYEGQQNLDLGNRHAKEGRSKSKSSKPRSESRNEDRQRHRSRSRHHDGRNKLASGPVSRRTTPEPYGETYARGRSKSKIDGANSRSPSSPLPMAPSEEDLRKPVNVEPALRLVSRNRERRERSNSRRRERTPSTRRERSPDRRRHPARSTSAQPIEHEVSVSRRGSLSTRAERRQNADQFPPFDRRGRHEIPSLYDSSVYSSIAPSDSISQVSTVDPVTRSASTPQHAGDRLRKELAAAELEARRLSLARRPSAPPIPLPGHLTLHGKSASMDTAPPLMRSRTADFVPRLENIDSFVGRIDARKSPAPTASDSGSSGRGSNGKKYLPGTPRAMRHPLHSQDPSVPDIPDNLLVLGSQAYQPNRDANTTPRMASVPPIEDFESPVIPANLPKHPAFDIRIPNSRSNSKADENRRAVSRDREMSRDRGASRDRSAMFNNTFQPPPVLPELQHLVTPPPPPPPPPPPAGLQDSNLVVQTSFPQSAGTGVGPTTTPATVPLPQSSSTEPPAGAYGHRRGRSGGGDNFVGKIRDLAFRMRSSSRGRDAKSPPIEETTSPYESIPLPPNTYNRGKNDTRSPQIPEEETFSPYESVPPRQTKQATIASMI